MDGLTALSLSFWPILEYSIRQRVLLLALCLSLCHLNEKLSFEASFCTWWWRNLISKMAFLLIIILAYFQLLCLFSVRKHCFRGSGLLHKFISSTLSARTLDRIDFSLCSRICTNTKITCLVHFHRIILLFIWLISQQLSLLLCYVTVHYILPIHHCKFTNRHEGMYKRIWLVWRLHLLWWFVEVLRICHCFILNRL